MRGNLAGLVLALVLLGCGQTAEHATQAPSNVDSFAASDARGREEAPANQPAPQDQPQGGNTGATTPQTHPNGPAPVLFLAYTYQMDLELPGARLASVMDAHVRACQQAGPRLCQLIGSQRQGDPDSVINGSVSLRGEPNWLRGFMNGVAHDASAAGGSIRSQTTTTEDLTRDIVDTEATLRAQRELRDRLESLLRTQRGRLADLLEVERELARVQGVIDSTQSELAVMQTRVAMSTLTLNYESSARPLRSDTFKPLGDAFAGFLGIVMQGFAWIVTLIAVLLPFAIVLGPLAWAFLAWRKRRRASATENPPGPRPPAA